MCSQLALSNALDLLLSGDACWTARRFGGTGSWNSCSWCAPYVPLVELEPYALAMCIRCGTPHIWDDVSAEWSGS
jgi:hypothetical protein